MMTKTNDKVNLLDVVRRLANKEDFNVRQKQTNDRALTKFKEMGMSNAGAFNFELRSVLPNNENLVGTQSMGIYGRNAESKVLDKVLFFDNLQNNAKLPFIDFRGVEWCDDMPVRDDNELINTKLTPHRLATSVTISREYLNNVEQYNDMLLQMLVNAVYGKLVQSMFSASAGTSTSPRGLFGDLEQKSVATLADLQDLQYEGDRQMTNNIWIVSPKAKRAINRMAATPLISNGELLNNPAICSSKAQDGIIGYIPLEYVAVGQWACGSITIDHVSRAKEGEIIIYIDTYFDFANLNPNFVKVGIITENNG